MKTKVYILRHAQSVANERNLVQGSGIGVPLSETGKEQARKIALALKDESFIAIYASTAVRATDTAAEIRKYHAETPYEELAILVERSKGDTEGMDRDAFRNAYPEVQAEWDAELDARPPGGENFEDVHARVMPVIERHVLEHGPDTALLYVLHGNVNRVILGHMLGIPYNLQSRIKQDYCAMNIAEYDHSTRRWSVQVINQCP